MANRSNDIFCYLFVGYYLSSLFGAVVIMDILFWVVFFYVHFLRLSDTGKNWDRKGHAEYRVGAQ